MVAQITKRSCFTELPEWYRNGEDASAGDTTPVILASDRYPLYFVILVILTTSLYGLSLPPLSKMRAFKPRHNSNARTPCTAEFEGLFELVTVPHFG